MAPYHFSPARRRFLVQLLVAASAPHVVAQEAPRVRPAFDLVTHTGRRVTQDVMKGSPSLVFFGFTGCPDICPTTLFEITQLYGALGPRGDLLKTFFVTVDPENDTPERLALYLSSFDPRIVGLTGDRAHVEAALKAFLAYADKTETAAGASWSHSAGVYVHDRAGAFVGFLELADGAAAAAATLQPLLGRKR
ncbi:MAG: hypothetical protein JWL93_2040 [Hyphomicrobiales bacterium]|nr:hypothetical protein [Hyphomicrobiales bacterium]